MAQQHERLQLECAMAGYLFRNGPIYPMVEPGDLHEVLLVRDRTIAYVGSEQGLDKELTRDVETVDLDGRPLLPGLCDSHLHLVLAALEHGKLDCRGIDSSAALQAQVRAQAAAKPRGSWVTGNGWERRLLFETKPPTPALLDRAAPDHPVLLVSKDWHSALFNSAGLAQVLKLPRLPDRCVIQRRGGEPTGLVLEDIFELRDQLLPVATRADKLQRLGPLIRHLWSLGITTVHTHETPENLRLVAGHLVAADSRVRVLGNVVFGTPEELIEEARLFERAVPGWLAPAGVKLFADGTFGSLTAAVTEPYANTTERGILNYQPHELSRWLEAIRSVGAYAVVHAIGDRAVELTLDALQQVTWPAGIRHRIEHGQLISEAIAARDDLGTVVFSGQPSHMWADRGIVERHLRPEIGQRWAYAYQTLLRRTGLLVFGSDGPVEDADPWAGIQAAVTRLEGDGAPPWNAAERLTLHDALAAHTAWPAQLHGRAFPNGVLAPGRLADLAVLNTDPFELGRTEPTRLRHDVRAELTFLGGELVYERSASAGVGTAK